MVNFIELKEDPSFQTFLNQFVETKIQEHEAKKDPIEEFNKLLENPRVKAFLDKIVEKKVNEELERAKDGIKEIVKEELDTSFDNRLITSDLEVLPRIRATEKVTGLYIFEEWEEHPPTIPEQITELKEMIKSNPLEAAPLKIDHNTIIPETKTEARALFLVEYLEKEVKERNGEFFLNGTEIKDFITRIIPTKDPELAPKKDQNIRKIKKDVLAKVKKIFGNKIEINANKHGRHETRVLLRSYPSVT